MPGKAWKRAVYCCTQAVSQRSLASTIRSSRGFSSAGRAPALQAGGRRFDPVNLHHDSETKQT
jgi:hypothetical protein